MSLKLSRCRYILNKPADGAMNMALDEALLEAATSGGRGSRRAESATLRIYQWARPTLSLGYFQAAADRDTHQASRQCDLVRRPSGGGAILHDRELTYALMLPEAIAATRPATQWYLDVHKALISALRRVGDAHQASSAWDMHLAGDTHQTGSTPLLCFQRRAGGDVLLCNERGEHKIAGSAQRRRRGAILQHGSVLLSRSPYAPELPGVDDLTDGKVDFDQLAPAFRDEFAKALCFDLQQSAPSEAEQQSAARLRREKYAAPAWTLRR